MKHSIALVGFGGYGAKYLKAIIENPMPEKYSFDAAVDFQPKSAPGYPWLVEKNVPIYGTLAEMYKNHSPDYVIISTPVTSHLPMITQAMENGSHVLCEKPLFPVLQDARTAGEVIKKTGKILSVGFNWCYSSNILNLKNDILSGVLGAPVKLNACVTWKRYDRYFTKPWSGKYKLPTGDFVCDTVLSNATAHYLHNILWLSGNTLNSSATPVSATASVYRAKDIETYDTVFLRGKLSTGGEFYYSASHSMDGHRNAAYIDYEFENAVVKYGSAEAPRLTAHFKNGTVKDYGAPNADNLMLDTAKTFYVLDIINGLAPEICGLNAVMPHLKVCNAVLEKCPVNLFPEKLVLREKSNSGAGNSATDEGTFVQGLYDEMLAMYKNNQMPHEIGAKWAAGAVELGNLEDYDEFKGMR